MPATNNYKAPTGFYQNYTFDKNGQLFADGKELNGVRIDGVKTAGNIMGLSTDSKGNVFAEVAAPKTPTPTEVGFLGMNSGSLANTIVNGSYQSANPFLALNTPQTTKVQLSGVQLDPARFSKSGNGDLGDNQLYLRPDDSGAYFAQINKGDQIAAYAYSAIQQAANPTGGPEAPSSNNQRRQGGNAGGGVSPTSGMVSLLGD